MANTKEHESAFFSLSLRFFHPSIDPDEITKQLNKSPKYSWKAGEQAKNLKGEPLNFVREQSYWCGESIARGGKDFPIEIERIVEQLASHREFLSKISEEGGRAAIYLHFPGCVNIGNTLDIKLLSRLVDLNIELDIEVFPHMKYPQD